MAAEISPGRPGSEAATRARPPTGGLVDLALILGIALLVAVGTVVLFGAQLATILDLIGAQVQQPG